MSTVVSKVVRKNGSSIRSIAGHLFEDKEISQTKGGLSSDTLAYKLDYETEPVSFFFGVQRLPVLPRE